PAANFASVDRKNPVVEAPAATLPLLSVVSFTTMAEPGIAAVTVLIALTARSANVTTVCSRSTLLLGLVSVSARDTLAVFVKVPMAVVPTTMITVALAPLAKLPRSQTMILVPVQLPALGVAETKVTAPGNVSVNSTSVAISGPLLVIVIVYVTFVPTVTGSGVSLLVTLTSAQVVTQNFATKTSNPRFCILSSSPFIGKFP